MSTKKKVFSKSGIPLDPFHVRDGSWFYVDRSHLTVVKERRTREGECVATASARIPWGQIMRQAAKCGRWDAKQELWFPRKSR